MNGEYAVVLGCSTGVGARIAVELAEAGYRIIGFHRGRHQEEADAVTQEIDRMGRWAAFHVMDVGSSYQQVQNGVALVEALTEPESIRILVHSLSGASTGDACTLPPEKVEKTFNVLAHSFLWWIQGLVTKTDRFKYDMRILALSNPNVSFYLEGSGVIGPAKAALEGYVRILAAEWGAIGKINALRFGAVLTPALETTIGKEAVENLRNVHKRLMPESVMLTAENVAQFARTLLTDKNSRMTGAVVDYTCGSVGNLMNYALKG